MKHVNTDKLYYVYLAVLSSYEVDFTTESLCTDWFIFSFSIV